VTGKELNLPYFPFENQSAGHTIDRNCIPHPILILVWGVWTLLTYWPRWF